MEWAAQDIALIVSTVAAAIATMFSKRFVEAIKIYVGWRRELKAATIAQKELDRELDEKGYRLVLRRMDRQMNQMRDSHWRELGAVRSDYDKQLAAIGCVCDELRAEHADCREQLGLVTGQYQSMAKEHEEMKLRLDKLNHDGG